jgi:hypothetical protein
VRVPAVVVDVAVSERDDGQVLDGVGLAGDLEERVELLQLSLAAVVVEVSRKEVPVFLLVEGRFSRRQSGAKGCWASDTATRGVQPYGKDRPSVRKRRGRMKHWWCVVVGSPP